ncbi:MAG TPA: glycosyl transferase family 2 [Syntrophobacteraceae bacterium]|nr:glycosyl transferase family 2 [Syntrophobacteraceae bacterium]
MESFVQLSLSILFLIAVILIWFMIGYQLLLTVAGFFHQMRSRKERAEVDAMTFDFPPVSVLIPAHNEEIVMAATLEAMLALDYPRDRLEILVINDGSTDATGEIVADYVRRDNRIVLLDVPKGEGGKGKSRALNLGLGRARSPIIAVYDADNTPSPDALKYLVSQLLLHSGLGAVLGKFRTINKNRNLLTRFINIETLSFQSMLQAGRWRLFRIATLPGTNFVIRKEVLDQLGGWDEEAITEDSELSIRMYMNNWRIKFIPYAVTYEQEPERWDVWLRQRTRWVRGNNYVAKKFFGLRKEIKSTRLRIEILYLFAMYYIFFVAILMSDFIFLLTATRLVSIPLPGPYNMVWILAVILFFGEILLALSYDREDSPRAMWYMVLMYFTYCQLWIVVVAKAFYLDVVLKEKRVWVKTVRFRVEPD